ncbi:hypothetical protein A3A09_02015 [Candidatus Nomurabacteria bacterium RIFCSPLOWO2_01_FULL_42_20]|uniref:Pilus assembly protein PilO n=1 Tax=Candidatus Nomurabacteria bacterium RIFCSPHIGHO2_01_FULL_42_16 TaxID=1801743 RepID=A0A1F6VK88_9BACT|nr:MAG: hypothetical protein A2824_03660 [Candidatus Nomurabacteria bacterium RIFCSPHIGHO2_01_FULL_42_16]OGI92166.1 MAG: hypothetical protein A3A09_02015 [Candidatus Nomurabacteria bacterium RIFCSPLOWO2_01_FULL_42_20]
MLFAAISLFFVFINPYYKEVQDLGGQENSYQEAIANSRELEKINRALQDRYQSIGSDDVKKLSVLLPDYVNNVQVAIEIEQIGLAAGRGMTLKNVKYEVPKPETEGRALSREQALLAKKNYGIFELSFSTEGSYGNFISFLKDLEQSLRVIDIESISFASTDILSMQGTPRDIYKYDFKVKTYWLKSN